MTAISRVTRSRVAQLIARAVSVLVATALVITSGRQSASAQSLPGTPVFESTGYGAVRPWFDMARATQFAMRSADAGADAEFVTLNNTYPGLSRVERWKVTSIGVPYFAGYVALQYRPTTA